MTTFVISVGVDPDKLRVQEMPDSFGGFKTKKEAATRLLEIVNGRMEELRQSHAHAVRILGKIP